MIQNMDFLEGANPALWVNGGADSADLARAAAIAADHAMGMLSVDADDVATVWPWVETRPIAIYARVLGVDVPAAAAAINAAFKHGAAGAQVLIPRTRLNALVNDMGPIRDDLFFNRDLIVGLDLATINYADWGDVFDGLGRLRADGLLIRGAGEMPDFVGRIYGMLDAWDDGFDGAIQLDVDNDVTRMEQTVRLIQKMRPDLLNRTHIFMMPSIKLNI